jgi:hypothetical protein
VNKNSRVTGLNTQQLGNVVGAQLLHMLQPEGLGLLWRQFRQPPTHVLLQLLMLGSGVRSLHQRSTEPQP